MEMEGLQGIFLSNQSNFSWLSDGGRGHVALASEASAASFFVTMDEVCLIVDNIEAQRLQDEELGIKCQIKEHPWYDDNQKAKIISELFEGKRVGADTPMKSTIDIASKIAELRYILTDDEVKRYRHLGQQCGEAIGKICKEMEAGLSEFQIAGMMSSELYSRSIDPIVLLVAVDERVSLYRHPLPTDKRVEKYGMIVVCGRQYGLIASVTRLFHFGPLSDELRKKHDAVAEVDTVFIAESRSGTVVGDIFATARKMYSDKGYTNEWTFHHQGGPAGYAPRDYRGVPGIKSVLLKPQAVAWNPSIKGTKSEDTIITTDNKPEIITSTPDWPMISITYKGEIWHRPDILVI
jgi:Xaa-Pro aminopeptidase